MQSDGTMILKIRKDLKSYSSLERAKVSAQFFKTGKGEYGEGDRFLGVRVPDVRSVAKKHYGSFDEKTLQTFLRSPMHEERLLALLVLVILFQKSTGKDREKVVNAYLKALKKGCVNNWDLVDLTADKILGVYLLDKDKSLLRKLSKSKSLWERRVAIVCTYEFIRNHEFTETFKLVETLIHDKEDLMHKACGWMLREVGKRDQKLLERFLTKHIKNLPRTSLRYAIERFPERKRKAFLKL